VLIGCVCSSSCLSTKYCHQRKCGGNGEGGRRKGVNEKGVNEKGVNEKGVNEKGVNEKGVTKRGERKGVNEKDRTNWANQLGCERIGRRRKRGEVLPYEFGDARHKNLANQQYNQLGA
jgi:hypothetical protein